MSKLLAILALIGAMTLGLLIDPAAGDAERDAGERPVANELKAGADNADEMTAIDARQMLFDVAAVLADINGVGVGRCGQRIDHAVTTPRSLRRR